MSRRSPSAWSLGDRVQVPSKVIHYLGGAVAVAPSQVGEIVCVSPLKVKVDLYLGDSRDNYVEAKYGWDELSEPKNQD